MGQQGQCCNLDVFIAPAPDETSHTGAFVPKEGPALLTEGWLSERLWDSARAADCSLLTRASLPGGRALKQGRHGGCLQLGMGRLEKLGVTIAYRLPPGLGTNLGLVLYLTRHG